MKNNQIQKAQFGTILKKIWNTLGNAAQVAQIAEAPSVMTASGWRVDRNGKAVQDQQNNPAVEQLRDNLATIGEAAIAAPTAVKDVELAYQAVRHPIQTARAVKTAATQAAQATKQLVAKGKNAVQRFKESRNFKSELDWSPESWFGTRPPYIGYDPKDVAELKRHVPEYLEIERKAKANGTWLKMPDGTTWTGDPRSWVQFMSKNVQKHNPEQFWTGIKHGVINPEYDQQVWGTFGQGKLSAAKARTYAADDEHVLPMFSKKNVPTTQYDANGSVWFNINGRTTNDIVNKDFSRGIKTIKIKNVTDTGPNIVTPRNSPKYTWGDAMTDYDITNNAGVLQNDIIISPNSFRKSLLGNNGAFSHPTNIFRTLTLPISTFTGYKLVESKINQ